MPLILSQRDDQSQERMDDPYCNIAELRNTYHQFARVNKWVSQWRYIYRQHIRPHLDHNYQYSLLDIGFGGGDIPIKLAGWAIDDGFDLKITAIDPDPRAMDFVSTLEYPPNINFLQCELSQLNPRNEQFDFVISNHLIHHLTPEQLLSTLDFAQKLSKISVLFNDLRRSDVAYLLFNIFSRPIFRSSFITEDGLTSIQRSYTQQELDTLTPKGWETNTLFPFRLLLTYNHE